MATIGVVWVSFITSQALANITRTMDGVVKFGISLAGKVLALIWSCNFPTKNHGKLAYVSQLLKTSITGEVELALLNNESVAAGIKVQYTGMIVKAIQKHSTIFESVGDGSLAAPNAGARVLINAVKAETLRQAPGNEGLIIVRAEAFEFGVSVATNGHELVFGARDGVWRRHPQVRGIVVIVALPVVTIICQKLLYLELSLIHGYVCNTDVTFPQICGSLSAFDKIVSVHITIFINPKRVWNCDITTVVWAVWQG